MKYIKKYNQLLENDNTTLTYEAIVDKVFSDCKDIYNTYKFKWILTKWMTKFKKLHQDDYDTGLFLLNKYIGNISEHKKQIIEDYHSDWINFLDVKIPTDVNTYSQLVSKLLRNLYKDDSDKLNLLTTDTKIFNEVVSILNSKIVEPYQFDFLNEKGISTIDDKDFIKSIIYFNLFNKESVDKWSGNVEDKITESVSSIVNDSMTRSWLSDPAFKKIHIKNIGDILKRVYEPVGHWKKNDKSGFYGVMDLEWDSERWSILNRINTNYTALTLMVNSINNALDNSSINKFDFVNNKFGTPEFYTEYSRLIELMKKNSKIFLKLKEDDGSKTINLIVNAIRGTKSAGDLGEKIVVDYLPKLNPKISNIRIPDGSGDSNDMIGGADVFFDYNDKTFTIQVKRVSSVIDKDGKYITVGASISKHYKTNYYAIMDRKTLYFFNNKESGINILDGELEIDNSLLVKSFVY